ncbi:sugar ABC transporter substrate-binding protein [Sinomonas atrocyanea]|jgi:ribose transport system substrate-binding protein|uniref:sugar ABC transporter substrate-binding protein n=1 Tax=Sinomonas atrocyanea TaxID=37927 RepID=UPI00277EBCF5|nr:sugar ABC transporter substrate-binding protein [Sinomonas atrocyanea]MDQ0260397.1 ribose transport system substrate-binding protein [Sinomonas atrocyanea]
MRAKFGMFVALIAAATLFLTGCGGAAGGSSSGKPFKVIAFTSGNQTPIGAWWVKAVTAKAKELGWNLTMIQGDFDFQKMNPAVESAIGQGADAILDGYTDIASIGSIVSAAKDAGIPIFAVDSSTSDTDGFAVNITTNQQQIADTTVGALDKSLGGLKGKNVMVIGHDPHPGIRMRASLAEKELKAAGANIAGGDIQKVKSPATGRTEALALVADYLSAHPNGLDAVWVGWDDAALGATKALSEARSSAKVTGVDATSEALAQIKSGGNFLATINQPWPSITDEVIKDVTAYQKDKTLPKERFKAVDAAIVDASNAASVTPSDKLG